MMNKTKICILGLIASVFGFQSCLESDGPDNTTDALVTVKLTDDGKSFFQLDEQTTLFPQNVTTKLYDGKEVRALINFEELEKQTPGFTKTVMVNAIDSIRTKEMKLGTADKPLDAYGNDPIDIVNDWVTIAEDGYLTLRLRAAWGIPAKKHVFDLVGGVDNEDPFVVELRHDATGGSSTGQDDNTLMDSRRANYPQNTIADVLIAFRLSHLPAESADDQKLTVRWKSSNGAKEVKFNLHGNIKQPEK